jgi:hypothetical protein
MNEAIDGGRSKGVVVVQHAHPISECTVGGDHDGSTFIPVRDDLKQEFGALFVHGQEAQFIDDEELGGFIGFYDFQKRVVRQRCRQVIDEIHGGGIEGFDSRLAGQITQSDGEVYFPAM